VKKRQQHENLMTYTRSVDAANDESFVDGSLALESQTRPTTPAWNAYEVWRTRIWDTHGPGPRAT
jgi:hypothetical protein